MTDQPPPPTATDVLTHTARWSIDRADCLDWLRQLPADSVDLVFASPPYERARLYLERGRDLKIARDTESWVSWMLDVCQELRRVCRGLVALVVEGQTVKRRYTASPFLLAADLHRRGFNLRKPCVFRRNGVPGSGGDEWLRNDWEPIICFARPGKLPWSCPTACGRPCRFPVGGRMSNRNPDGRRVNAGLADDPRGQGKGGRRANGSLKSSERPQKGYTQPEIANPGNVIKFKVGGGHMGHHLAHENEAPFPQALAEFFVRTFCPVNGVVCDPFSGSGTTVAAAIAWQRRGIGCDLRESQVRIARQRVSETTPTMFPE